jgi:hypothetical protein
MSFQIEVGVVISVSESDQVRGEGRKRKHTRDHHDEEIPHASVVYQLHLLKVLVDKLADGGSLALPERVEQVIDAEKGARDGIGRGPAAGLGLAAQERLRLRHKVRGRAVALHDAVVHGRAGHGVVVDKRLGRVEDGRQVADPVNPAGERLAWEVGVADRVRRAGLGSVGVEADGGIRVAAFAEKERQVSVCRR